MLRLLCRFALSATVASVGIAAAEAHAFLDHASPTVGGEVARPAEVTLWFSEEVEPIFSGVIVTNAAGDRLDDGKIVADPHNAQELHVPLKPLWPGVYKVQWHVVSVDTHRTEGDFSFTVAPG